MNKEIAAVKNYAPAVTDGDNLREAILENLDGLDVNVFDLETIKVPSSGSTSWEVVTVDGAETVKELEGVIIGTQVARAYWPTGFDSGGSEPPQCSSNDGIRGQGSPGGLCGDCSMASFGSDGKRGQACKLILRLFFLRPGAMLPSLIPLPPTSLKPAKAYLLGLASKGVQSRRAATGISLEKDKNKDGIAFSKAKFRMINRLPEDQAVVIENLATAILPTLKKSSVTPSEVAD